MTLFPSRSDVSKVQPGSGSLHRAGDFFKFPPEYDLFDPLPVDFAEGAPCYQVRSARRFLFLSPRSYTGTSCFPQKPPLGTIRLFRTTIFFGSGFPEYKNSRFWACLEFLGGGRAGGRLFFFEEPTISPLSFFGCVSEYLFP